MSLIRNRNSDYDLNVSAKRVWEKVEINLMHRRLILPLALAVTSTAFAQGKTAVNSEDRLLPQTVTESLKLEVTQDGRSVDLAVNAPATDWVITSLLVHVRYKTQVAKLAEAERRLAVAQTKRLPPGAGNHEAVEAYIDVVSLTAPEAHTLKVEIAPGRRRSVYLEAKNNEPIATIQIIEARGRPQTWTDRMNGFFR